MLARDITRLRREALLASALPPRIRHPELVSAGDDGDLAWTVTRWVDGQALHTSWPRLCPAERRAVASQLAETLAALHEWTPPPAVASALDDREPVNPADPAALVGTSLVPLPVTRAFALAEHARTLPGTDRAVVDAALARLHELAAHDPYRGAGDDQVVVHGDAHLANLLWRDGRVVAMLDLEWARLGPPDLELEPLLRSVDWTGHDPDAMPLPEMARLLGWLAADHGRLFAATDLTARLWLYQLAFTPRSLFTRPLDPPADHLPAHPLNLLRVVSQGTAHLERVLAHTTAPRNRP